MQGGMIGASTYTLSPPPYEFLVNCSRELLYFYGDVDNARPSKRHHGQRGCDHHAYSVWRLKS
eukprot:scaffold200979_cov27-Prasinocladus_malaysianus.AAC.1